MRRIAIEHAPDLLIRVPPMALLHKATHVLGALAVVEGPTAPPGIDLVGGEQREKAMRLLRLLQHEPLGRRKAAPAIGLDRNRLDVEEQQHASAGPMVPDPADSRQDRAAARGVADELALDAPKAHPPFRSTRRKCSRLMALTTRRLMRYSRSLASDHRPHGKPTSPGGVSAKRRISAGCWGKMRTGAPPRRRCRTLATPNCSKACRSEYTVLTWASSAPAISAASKPAACSTMASARRRCRAVSSSSNMEWSCRTSTVRGCRVFKDRGMAGPPAQGWSNHTNKYYVTNTSRSYVTTRLSPGPTTTVRRWTTWPRWTGSASIPSTSPNTTFIRKAT